MKRSEKQTVIDNLTQEINSYNHFYLADISDLNAEKTSELRRLCFQKDVKLIVVKNTLLQKALEASGKNAEELFVTLKGNTSLMFSESSSLPAKLIQEFRKKNKTVEEMVPAVKVAQVIDTTGCGDSFAGGLGYGLLQKPSDYISAAKYGNALGALRTQGKTFDVFKSLSETDAIIKKGHL